MWYMLVFSFRYDLFLWGESLLGFDGFMKVLFFVIYFVLVSLNGGYCYLWDRWEEIVYVKG